MNEVEQLIAYLYTVDARAAGNRLAALGAAVVEPLIAVISGTYPLPDRGRLKASDVPEALVACVELTPVLDAAAARERAAYLLGDIRDARAVEPLIAAYEREKERHICLAIVHALGEIGDARGVDTLIKALGTQIWTPEYKGIVNDLDRIGGEQTIEPLIKLVQSTSYSYGSAAQAARALARRRNDPRVLGALIGALRLEAEFSTLEAVFVGLGEIGDPRGARALLTFVTQMIALPAERWDNREENLSETERGTIYHVLKTEFEQATAVIRRIGDAETAAGLQHLLAGAPPYVPKPSLV